MSVLIRILRLNDGLILAEAMDSFADQNTQLDEYKVQANQLFRTFSRKSPKRMTIDSGAYYFCYLIENEVVYLALCEKHYPKKLALRFLEELQKEFDIQYGAYIATEKRPYAFIKFDTFIQKTKKVYADTRSHKNLHKVSEDLSDVHRIMSKNITEILGRGEKIESVAKKSDELLAGAEYYEKQAKQLNTSLFLRKYGFIIIAVVIVVFVVYWRFY